MSVPKSQRSGGQLDVATKALELESYSIDMCSSEKRVPKKARPFVAYPLVDCARNIVANIYRANDVYVWDEQSHRQRIAYQEAALAEIAALIHLVDLFKKKYNLSDKSVVHWVGLALDTREKLRSWRNADKRKYMKMWVNDC